jgi:hypothetical protein
MTNLETLTHLAETLDGCEWNHPLCSVEVCRLAADELERGTITPEIIARVAELHAELHRLRQGIWTKSTAAPAAKEE